MTVVGDLGGISETATRGFIKETTLAIAALRPRYVCFPDDLDELKMNFWRIARFPNVIGAIDCTHVRLLSPGGDFAEVFRNRKGYFSLNVQTVCDANLRVLDCVARWPGSTHDQRIFNNSRLKHNLENGTLKGKGTIVGDCGYENTSYVVTPLATTATAAENLFNEAQIRTRNPIERSYGVIKKRYPVLSVGLRCKLPLATAVVQAVMVLHNIALDEPLPALDIDLDSYEEAKIIVERQTTGNVSLQRKLVDQYFNQLQ